MTMLKESEDQARLRKIFKLWLRSVDEGRALPYPGACDQLRCNAKTRFGTLCKRRDLGRGGRCKLHGGHSTGPESGPTARKRPHPEPFAPRKDFDPAQSPGVQAALRVLGIDDAENRE